MVKIIGVTGGVGAGKSSILEILNQDYGAYIIMADEVGHRLMEIGGATYNAIIDEFGDKVDKLLLEDKTINRQALAEYIFNDKKEREKLNEIVHPLVINAIKNEIESVKNAGKCDLIILEAAILNEGNLDKICDEVWYIYAAEEVRIKRLIESRNYSREKALGIIKSQATETKYRNLADYTIDNGGSLEDTRKQIKLKLENGN